MIWRCSSGAKYRGKRYIKSNEKGKVDSIVYFHLFERKKSSGKDEKYTGDSTWPFIMRCRVVSRWRSWRVRTMSSEGDNFYFVVIPARLSNGRTPICLDE